MSRDPRQDPRRGDELRVLTAAGDCCVGVDSVTGNMVGYYRLDGIRLWTTTLALWRRECVDAEVLKVAP